MKQVKLIKTKPRDLEVLVNRALSEFPNADIKAVINWANKALHVVIQYEI